MLPAGVLAQLQATVDDPDNVCCVCKKMIDGPSAEVVVFTDGEAATLVKLAHSNCMSSGLYRAPGLGQAFDARAATAEGFAMATLLGFRQRQPRGLIFLEPEVLVAGPNQDPLELYADALGLEPVSGSIEAIDPPNTEAFAIVRTAEGLGLRAAHGIETVPAGRADLSAWFDAAAGRAIVIVGRGLGLARSAPTIEEALALRPVWAACAKIADPSTP